MSGPNEDAGFQTEEEAAGQDAVMAALEDQVSGQYSNIDTSRGVEDVDFGGMQVVTDEMEDIQSQVNAVTADDWQPETGSVPSEGVSEIPSGDQGMSGLS